jgi:hypothetical protein
LKLRQREAKLSVASFLSGDMKTWEF